MGVGARAAAEFIAPIVFHVLLYEPEIPPNTGNVIRLCANTGCTLHLIGRLGFRLDDKQLIRAGLDYHEFASVRQHDDFASCVSALVDGGRSEGRFASPGDETEGRFASPGGRIFALSTRNAARYDSVRFAPGDAFLFGPETRGLPQALLDEFAPERRLRLPMRPENRSLNLSNAVAVVVFEAWRQQAFAGGA
jgi:tRNA (cytidine/uridine-2'-O-)-methyltransferase